VEGEPAIFIRGHPREANKTVGRRSIFRWIQSREPALAIGLPQLKLSVRHRDARAIDAATLELKKVAPEPASYLSESNFFNEHWQQAYFGGHYPRLRAIKKQYDPAGLFFVHHGVGGEEWSADGFTRVTS